MLHSSIQPIPFDRNSPWIFRLTHIDNIKWMVTHGLHSRNSEIQDPDFHAIGNQEIIEERAHKSVPIQPGGTLGDFIPFYFTPFSPMYHNIRTGYHGITRVPKEELVFLVGRLLKLRESGYAWIFADRNANLDYARYHSEVEALNVLDWESLEARDYRRDPNRPDRFERYQAEALIHNHLPLSALSVLVSHSTKQAEMLKLWLDAGNVPLKVDSRPDW